VLHELCQKRLEAYADGDLRRPFTWLVEFHTKKCAQCRQALKAELALVCRLDEALFTRAEIVQTAVATTRTRLHGRRPAFFVLHNFSWALAGAALLLLCAGIWPMGMGLFSPSPTVVAASSWAEGYAISVFEEIDMAEESGSYAAHSSGVGQGFGTPVVVSEERGG
jgi:predicted anti-sigma-YlaC factor YlaD